MTTPNLLDVRELSIRFRSEDGFMDAVKNVSFSLKRGRVAGHRRGERERKKRDRAFP